VVQELADKDDFAQKVYQSYSNFLQGCREWSKLSEIPYLRARDGV
jgi:TRAP-type mannitol/chloroaromatic compound transport system substrate-binding protein